jgi:hypothetical protein
MHFKSGIILLLDGSVRHKTKALQVSGKHGTGSGCVGLVEQLRMVKSNNDRRPESVMRPSKVRRPRHDCMGKPRSHDALILTLQLNNRKSTTDMLTIGCWLWWEWFVLVTVAAVQQFT